MLSGRFCPETHSRGDRALQRVTILFLAANPSDEARLQFDKERRAIEDEIRKSVYRDWFKLPLSYEPNINSDRLIEAFRQHKPQIVHFAGHGTSSSEIILQNAAGTSRRVQSDQLEELFRLHGQGVKLVVLNACYSSSQAKAITRHVPCAVGMQRAIPDATAVAVAVTMYQGLANGESVQNVFDTAQLQLKLQDPDSDGANRDLIRLGGRAVESEKLLVLHVRAGTDAHRMFVVKSVVAVVDGKREPRREDGGSVSEDARDAAMGAAETSSSPAARAGESCQLAGVSTGKNRFEADRRTTPREDCDEIVDVSIFFGRTRELKELCRAVRKRRVRVIAILGFGGIGKTALSEKLVERVKPGFQFLFRRSLKDAPPIEQLLADCIRFVSGEPDIAVPRDVNGLIGMLIKYLGQHSCLIVLDNAESILQTGRRVGTYRDGYEGYGVLMRKVGETVHRSCLLITSREKPEEIATLEGVGSSVFSLNLDGLGMRDAITLLKRKGLSAPRGELETVVGRYKGNALALMIAASYIQDTPGGSVASFLRENVSVVGDIRELVCQQIERVAPLERAVVFWLAINREPTSLDELRSDLNDVLRSGALVDALHSLNRRSLIMPTASKFTLQPAVMEFVIEMLIERVCEEVTGGAGDLLETHALMKAQASDYIRESQVRLIVRPLEQCLSSKGRSRIPALVKTRLQVLRETQRDGFGAGNLLNLLVQVNADLTGFDFSHLTIKQAFLQGVSLNDTNFAHARFEKSVFTDTFGSVTCVRFSPDGSVVATACGDGTIRFWGDDGTHLRVILAHSDWVRSVAFHPEGASWQARVTIGPSGCAGLIPGS